MTCTIVHSRDLLVELFITLDSYGASCLVVEISAVKISAFSLMGLNDTLNVVLTAPKNTFEKLNSNVSGHRPCCEQFYEGKKVVLICKKEDEIAHNKVCGLF